MFCVVLFIYIDVYYKNLFLKVINIDMYYLLCKVVFMGILGKNIIKKSCFYFEKVGCVYFIDILNCVIDFIFLFILVVRNL